MNVAHGSELRPPYIDGSYQSFENHKLTCSNILRKETLKIYKKAKFLEKNCEIIIGSPLSSSFFLQKKFINSFYLGIPYHNKEDNRNNFENNNNNIRILHCPSNELIKGSNYIRKAIKSLKTKGLKFEYIEITNQPNSVVINEILKCTFIVDQIFSDTPLAGFATEAAWFKKPSIVGGYGLNELKKHVCKDNLPPSFICHPDEIENKIHEFIVNTELREKVAIELYNFVTLQWNSKNVASKYLKLIENTFDNKWLTDPNSNQYIYGVGQSEHITKKNVTSLINDYGLESLCLSDKKNLEKLFINLAN